MNPLRRLVLPFMFAICLAHLATGRISWDYEILGGACRWRQLPFVASLSARHFEFPPAPNRGDANPNALGADPRSGLDVDETNRMTSNEIMPRPTLETHAMKQTIEIQKTLTRRT